MWRRCHRTSPAGGVRRDYGYVKRRKPYRSSGSGVEKWRVRAAAPKQPTALATIIRFASDRAAPAAASSNFKHKLLEMPDTCARLAEDRREQLTEQPVTGHCLPSKFSDQPIKAAENREPRVWIAPWRRRARRGDCAPHGAHIQHIECQRRCRLAASRRRCPSGSARPCFIVNDANGQPLAYLYYEEELGRRTAAKLMT